MKNIFVLMVMFMSASAMAFQARVDLDGSKDGVSLKAMSKSDGCSFSNPSWIDERSKRSKLLYFASPVLEKEWKDIEFSFMANKDGKVYVYIRGEWHSADKGQSPKFVYFKKFEALEGADIKNTDFSGVRRDGSRFGWWYDMNAKLLPVFEKDGEDTIVKMQYANQMVQVIDVKKGQVVKIKATVKSAMP